MSALFVPMFFGFWTTVLSISALVQYSGGNTTLALVCIGGAKLCVAVKYLLMRKMK